MVACAAYNLLLVRGKVPTLRMYAGKFKTPKQTEIYAIIAKVTLDLGASVARMLLILRSR